MNRKSYLFGIFFLTLLLASGIFQGILHVLLDNQIFGLQSLATWILAMIIVSTIASLFLLRYFHFKKYQFTFYSGVAVTVFSLFYLFVLYRIVAARELQSQYLPFMTLTIVASIVHGISLIVSPAAERVWLKAAGICMLVVNLITASIVGWSSVYATDVQIQNTAREILQWTALTSQLVFVMFIVNFRREMNGLKTEHAAPTLLAYIENIFSFIGFSIFVFALVIGVTIAKEGHATVYWSKRNFENAQELTKVYEARTFVNSTGDTLRYRLLKPLDYDPQMKYPLVVSLHHGGVHGNDNVSQLSSEPSPILSGHPYRRKYPAFIFAPQSPAGSGFARTGNYPSTDSLVFEAMHVLENEFSIDEERRYVMGISGGGYGSWHFISMHPEMFAAAVPICGGGDPALAKNFVDVKVWAFHGEKDNLVPVKLSRDMIDALKRAGASPRYTEFPGEGHNIWGNVSKTSGELFDWMFAQKRE
jgi:dienelactone hydrolase